MNKRVSAAIHHLESGRKHFIRILHEPNEPHESTAAYRQAIRGFDSLIAAARRNPKDAVLDMFKLEQEALRLLQQGATNQAEHFAYMHVRRYFDNALAVLDGRDWTSPPDEEEEE